MVFLGPKVYRKEMLRLGTWSHPDAPGGKLEVTKEVFDKIVANFRAGLRDDVPVPLGHDLDALENAGHVVGLEVDDDKLIGFVEIKDDDIDKDLQKRKITGGSALLNLDYVDPESGSSHGPTLIHWALSNAPFIKGLAPYEAVALGEDAEGATVIALDDTMKGGSGMDPIKEALEKLADASDEDIRKALVELRPEILKSEGGEGMSEEDLEDLKQEARDEGREAVVAALSEKGIVVELSEEEGNGSGGDGSTKVDVTKSPEFVALSEGFKAIQKERLEERADALIGQAVKDGKVVPAQKDALREIALSEEDGSGLERVAKLIPDKPIVDLSELGVTINHETNVELSEEDADAEVERLVTAYAGGKKE